MFFDWLDRFIARRSRFLEHTGAIRKEGLELLSNVSRDVPKEDVPYEGDFSGNYVSVYAERRPRPENYHPTFGKRAHVYNPCYIRLTLPDGTTMEQRAMTMLDAVSCIRSDFLKRCMEL